MGITTLLTAEQFDNYPFEEDRRYELDEGELIELARPPYKHERVTRKLLFSLEVYFLAHPIGEPLPSENIYVLSPGTRRSPDLAIFFGSRRGELQGTRVVPIVPEIAVEILSPGETLFRIHRKLKQYFKGGVKEVWLIDPESQQAEVWISFELPQGLKKNDSLQSAFLSGFEVTFEELFS